MDYKFNNLKEQVYRSFIRGEYGIPTIPSESEVIAKVNELTTRDNVPITVITGMSDINLPDISKSFSSIIDDIGILFNSIEDESRDVLDQLTNSLKEHNGVKRELKRIKTHADDIVNGKLGEEYLLYNFTESFDDVSNINTIRSDSIDTDAGLFTIKDNSSVLVNMNHYINRRIIFNVIDNLAPIVEQGFIGNANAENILSKNNPKSIQYRVQTLRPTRLIMLTAFQLRSDSKPVSINSVGISVDSGVNKGFIRLYYQNGYQWKDVPGKSIQEIKGDSVLFGFDAVEATHIKFEFIKDYPDVQTNNEYFVNIYEVVIGKNSTRTSATVYSKPISVTAYDSESPVINNISCTVDADIPSDCKLKVSVAQDIKVSGSFVNSLGQLVYANSLDAVDFKPYPEATGFVYLSDIMEKQELSGLIPFRGYDFAWKDIKSSQALGDTVPELLEFNFTSRKPTIVNSLYNVTDALKYGDRSYTGPWPQAGEVGVYVSGWCNSDNPAWTPFLSGLVFSGFLASGIDLQSLTPGNSWDEIAVGNGKTEDDIGYESGIYSGILLSPDWSGQWLGYGSGYAYDFFDALKDRVIRYGDYANSVKGWWRPYSYVVKPSGIDTQYNKSGYLTDELNAIDQGEFYFNGLTFYKIYKFDKYKTVLDSTIRLYQYEDRPVSHENDEYNHSFKWQYKSALINEIKTLTNQSDPINNSSPNFSGYSIEFPTLSDNEEYSNFGVLEVKQHGTNFILDPRSEYQTILYEDAAKTISGVLLTGLSKTQPSLIPQGMSFDIKYNYKIKNKYLSTWTSYAIVSPNTTSEVVISNKNIYKDTIATDVKAISQIVVVNKEDGTVKIIKDSGDRFVIDFNTTKAKSNTHFKVTIYCAADESSGFSAKIGPGTNYFIPKETTGLMLAGKGIKFVSRLESLKICDLGTLLYDTPMANDRKCALITDYNDEKFLVVKKPSKDIFPGYIFDINTRSYSIKENAQIRNKGHYIRYGFDQSENSISYTTGSSGTRVYNPLMVLDTTWNNGNTYLDSAYKNTIQTENYPTHSTYGHSVNIEDTNTVLIKDYLTLYNGSIDPRASGLDESVVGSTPWSGWIIANYPHDYYLSYLENPVKPSYIIGPNLTVPNLGFLFYNTAENLPTFYSISYSTMTKYDDIAKRFLYKIDLESDGSKQISPKVRSIRFEINKGN